MKYLLASFEFCVLRRPGWTLAVLAVVVLAFAWHIPDFSVDSSADSLLLENDEDLKYFRKINRIFGFEDILILSVSAREGDIFARENLQHLQQLQDELALQDGVDSVLSIINAPLFYSPKRSIEDLSAGVEKLLSTRTDITLAKKEFLSSPLYKKLLLSPDGKTTAVLLNMKQDDKYASLIQQRDDLRALMAAEGGGGEAAVVLQAVEHDLHRQKPAYNEENDLIIENIRLIADDFHPWFFVRLGGVRMIVSDMLQMVRGDMAVFGSGVLVLMFLVLALLFRSWLWALLPLAIGSVSIAFMVGLMAVLNWYGALVSANFIALLMIISLSMVVHIAVRWQQQQGGADRLETLRGVVRYMFKPCLFALLTTQVAFLSLFVSDIRPIVDFGLAMTVGLLLAFALIFVILPCVLALVRDDGLPHAPPGGMIARILDAALRSARRTPRAIVMGVLIGFAVFAFGMRSLEVENSFIDYFNKDSEIYKSMLLLDQELGGTTPLDIVIESPAASWSDGEEAADPASLSSEEDDLFQDFGEYLTEDTSGGEQSVSYWLTSAADERLQQLQTYLEQQPEIGKVMSLAVILRLFSELNDDRPLSDIELPLVIKFLPESIKEILVYPYWSAQEDAVRLSMRVIDSDASLHRSELIQRIGTKLHDLGFSEQSFRINGTLVLYNNVLHSLFDSQIKTLGFVLLLVALMLVFLFRRISLALLAVVPSLLAVLTILGLMGWLAVPLDIMTITVAAICVGISVDNTIHYLVRYERELAVSGGNVEATITQCHNTVGRAAIYTSLVVISGLSVLTFSHFNPTIYFAIFSGLAFLVALFSTLILLPSLLILLERRQIDRRL